LRVQRRCGGAEDQGESCAAHAPTILAPPLGGIASVAILILAGWAALTPQPMAWLYVLVVAAFELWLARRIAGVGQDPVAAGTPPYHFTEDEARLVRRYRFYFTYPGIARDSSSVL